MFNNTQQIFATRALEKNGIIIMIENNTKPGQPAPAPYIIHSLDGKIRSVSAI
jgi:hypothetical protein